MPDLTDEHREALEYLVDMARGHDYAEVAKISDAEDVLFLALMEAEALRVVRLVEADMAEQATDAWRSADARRGLSDHEALVVHADALTRWSQRLRMAFRGEYYRADRIGGAS